MNDLSPRRMPVHESQPVAGYYKKRLHRGGPWVPVYISDLRPGDTQMQALVGDGKGGRTQVNAADIWTWCAGNPVDKAEAAFAFKNGNWPGDVKLGDNSGNRSALDEAEELLAEIAAFVKATPKITDKTQGDQAANWRTKATDVCKKVETQWDEEIAEAKKVIADAKTKFKPVTDRLEDAIKGLRRSLTDWLAAEDARVKAAAREAEKAMKEVVAKTGLDIPVVIEAPKVRLGGQTGSRIGLKKQTVWVVEDYAAVLAHVKDHPDVQEVVAKVARGMCKAGAAVPGMTSKVEQVAS